MEYGARKAALLIRSKGSGSKLISLWCGPRDGVRFEQPSAIRCDGEKHFVVRGPGESGGILKFCAARYAAARRGYTHTLSRQMPRGLAVNSRAALPHPSRAHSLRGPCALTLRWVHACALLPLQGGDGDIRAGLPTWADVSQSHRSPRTYSPGGRCSGTQAVVDGDVGDHCPSTTSPGRQRVRGSAARSTAG